MDWGANLGVSIDELGDHVPPPPYQLKDVTAAIFGCELNEAAARRLLPPGLELVEAPTGGMFLYIAERGGGIAPFGATAFWIDVRGYDSPTGSHARFVPRSFFSGRGGIAIGRLGSARHAAETAVVEADGIVEAKAWSDGDEIARVTLRPSEEVLPTSSGVNYYLFNDHVGGVSMFPLTFSYEPQTAHDTTVDIGGSEENLRRAFKIDQTLWSAFVKRGAFTIGSVHPLDQYREVDAIESAVVLQGILERLGTAALIVDVSGRVRFHNLSERALLGDGVSIADGMLRAWSKKDQAKLEGGIEAALSSRSAVASEAIDLERPSGGRPLLLSVAPLTTHDASLSIRAVRDAKRSLALVLIGDPEQPTSNDPTGALQVMGLTKAEADVAALIGKGSSPRAVAATLGKTEGTVRTDLKHVFSKLDLSRQSELALLVSRLGSLGF